MKNSAQLWNMEMACADLKNRIWLNKQFIIWLMRVSIVVFFFFLMSLQFLLAVPVKGQRISDYTVTLKLEDESLLSGLKKIEAQTVFRFYYRKAELRQITDLNLAAGTRTVAQTLYEMLKNTDLSFRQIDNNILLEKRRQTGYTIKGRVLGPDHKAAELATVQVINTANRQMISSALADTGGRFNLVVYEQGDYLLKVAALKTDSLIQKITVGNDKVLQLPDIILSASALQLSNVTIQGKRALINRVADKLILNVEGSVYEKGEDGLKLFNVIPGVQVTGKDILFRGSESVTVYVDNRKMMLPAEQLFAYLRSIPSESIKSYELKAVPGAESDAQNRGVIINIVLKSEYKYGLTGNVNTGYWYNGSDNRQGSTFMNYNTGKLNLTGGFNYRRAPAFYEDEIKQEIKATGVYSRQTEKYMEDYHSVGFNVGLDYKLDLRQTVGLNYNLFANPGDISNTVTTHADYFANARTTAVDSSINTTKSTDFRYVNQMANVFYRNKLDTAGSKLDIGYSYVQYDLREPSAVATQFLNSSGTEFHPAGRLFTKTTGNSAIHVANADLEKYFFKTLVLNLGAKYTVSETDYAMDYRLGLNEQAPLDPMQSNRFLYNEHILAFYSKLGQSFGHWNLKIGLRTEQTNYDGQSVTTGQDIGRNQWNFFPSLYVNRKMGENHSLTFSYARRIERPGFRQLNPFESYTSLNYIQEGNPDLKPYFSNNLQLEYLLKNKYSFTAGYQNTINGIETNVTNTGDVIISRDENISDNNNAFLSLYIPLKLRNWWEFNTSTTLRYNTIDVRGSSALHRSKFSQYVWATNKFNLPGKYFVEVSGMYSRNNFSGIYDQYAVGKLDITLKKSFFKDRLSSSVEFQDPFHLFKPGSSVNTTDFVRNSVRNKVDWARYAGIWLTYSFSSGKKPGRGEQIDAGGNEARRRL